MFILLVFSLFPVLSTAECVYPGYPDETHRDSRGYLSYYQVNSTLHARCLSEEMSFIEPDKLCQEDGTWKGVFTRCANDVARNLVWKPANDTCGKASCNQSTSWGLALEVVSYPNVEAFRFYSTIQLEPTNYTVELISRTGEWVRTVIRSADGKVSAQVRLNNVARMIISNLAPFSLWGFRLLSFSGPPLYNDSAPYSKTDNRFSRIVVSDVKEKRNFTEARQKCVSFGGRLLEAFDPETLEYMQHIYKPPRIWIGLSATNNTWMWESGKLFDQKLFAKFPIYRNPKKGLSISYDIKLKKLVRTNQKDKKQFACRLDSLPQGCISPGAPEAGRIIRTSAEQTEYECFNGYRMVGVAIRKCNMKTGHHETEIPECVKAD